MKTSTRVAVNAASKWISTLINALIGILLVTFLIRNLGQTGYGVTVLVTAIVALSGFLDLGLRGSLGRTLAEADAKSDASRLKGSASTAHALYVLLGTGGGLVIAVLAPWLADVFRIPEELWREGVGLIRFYASTMIFLLFLDSSYAARLISRNRYDMINSIDAIAAVVRAVLLVLTIGSTSLALTGWAIAMLAAQGVHLALLVVLSHYLCPHIKAVASGCSLQAARSLLLLGAKLFVFQITSLLSSKADPLIISRVLGAQATALYEPMVRLRSAAQPFANALGGQLYPVTTSFHATDDRRRLQAVLIRGTRYTFLLGSLVCVIFGVFSRPIADVWLSRSLGDGAVQSARVLAAWAAVDLFTYAAGTQWAVLLGMNRLGFLIWTQLPLAVVNVIASFLLVSFTSLGVVAVVIPTVVIGMVRRPIIIVHTAHACGISGLTYFKKAYVRPLVVLGIVLAAATALLLGLNPKSLVSLAMCLLATTGIWCVTTWMLAVSQEEREQVLHGLRRMLSLAVRRRKD